MNPLQAIDMEEGDDAFAGSVAKRKVQRWTAEEHTKLIALVAEAGGVTGIKWPLIAAQLPGRTGKQCRERWMNARPDNKKGSWDHDEEQLLARLHAELGPQWSKIARQLPGRTENDTKNHWNALLRCKTLEAKMDSLLCIYVRMIRDGAPIGTDTYRQAAALHEDSKRPRGVPATQKPSSMAKLAKQATVAAQVAGTAVNSPDTRGDAVSQQQLVAMLLATIGTAGMQTAPEALTCDVNADPAEDPEPVRPAFEAASAGDSSAAFPALSPPGDEQPVSVMAGDAGAGSPSSADQGSFAQPPAAPQHVADGAAPGQELERALVHSRQRALERSLRSSPAASQGAAGAAPATQQPPQRCVSNADSDADGSGRLQPMHTSRLVVAVSEAMSSGLGTANPARYSPGLQSGPRGTGQGGASLLCDWVSAHNSAGSRPGTCSPHLETTSAAPAPATAPDPGAWMSLDVPPRRPPAISDMLDAETMMLLDMLSGPSNEQEDDEAACEAAVEDMARQDAQPLAVPTNGGPMWDAPPQEWAHAVPVPAPECGGGCQTARMADAGMEGALRVPHVHTSHAGRVSPSGTVITTGTPPGSTGVLTAGSEPWARGLPGREVHSARAVRSVLDMTGMQAGYSFAGTLLLSASSLSSGHAMDPSGAHRKRASCQDVDIPGWGLKRQISSNRPSINGGVDSPRSPGQPGSYAQAHVSHRVSGAGGDTALLSTNPLDASPPGSASHVTGSASTQLGMRSSSCGAVTDPPGSHPGAWPPAPGGAMACAGTGWAPSMPCQPDELQLLERAMQGAWSDLDASRASSSAIGSASLDPSPGPRAWAGVGRGDGYLAHPAWRGVLEVPGSVSLDSSSPTTLLHVPCGDASSNAAHNLYAPSTNGRPVFELAGCASAGSSEPGSSFLGDAALPSFTMGALGGLPPVTTGLGAGRSASCNGQATAHTGSSRSRGRQPTTPRGGSGTGGAARGRLSLDSRDTVSRLARTTPREEGDVAQALGNNNYSMGSSWPATIFETAQHSAPLQQVKLSWGMDQRLAAACASQPAGLCYPGNADDWGCSDSMEMLLQLGS